MTFLQENRRAVIFLLAGLILIGAVYFSGDDGAGKSTVTIVPAVKPPEVSVGVQPVMPKGYQPEAAVRDPFLLPPVQMDKPPAAGEGMPLKGEGVKEKPKPVRPSLVGIADNGEGRQVVIVRLGTDSQTLGLHERIGEYRLVAVQKNTATFEGPEGTVVLRQER